MSMSKELRDLLRPNALLGPPRPDPINWVSSFRAENASRESFAPDPGELDELRKYFEEVAEGRTSR